MKDITKLSFWKDLKNLGFEPVKFRFHGKIFSIGGRLITENGEILIEPHYYSEKSYHITGPVKNPKVEQFFRYENGRKIEFFEQLSRINEFYSAREIIKTIQYMTN